MMKSMVGYAEAGYFSASVGYRLSPEAAFPAQIHDCKCAIRFLRGHAKRFALDPGRIGVVGWSAGGHLAALLGTSGGVRELEGDGGWPGVSSRVQAVCDYFGPADFTDWMTGHEWGAWNEDAKRAVLGLFGDARRNRPAAARMASPVTYASKDDPPFLIIHGTADPIVPFRQSELLREALRKAGVEAGLVTVEGAGHGDASFWAAKPWEPEAAFFARVLKAVRGI
jgi:acetyl esterase/lipase